MKIDDSMLSEVDLNLVCCTWQQYQNSLICILRLNNNMCVSKFINCDPLLQLADDIIIKKANDRCTPRDQA